MIKKTKFKISIQTYTLLEQNELVYKVLKEHPFGLLLGEIEVLTGIGTRSQTTKKILIRLGKKVYFRHIGARNTNLYYARIHAKKLIKMGGK